VRNTRGDVWRVRVMFTALPVQSGEPPCGHRSTIGRGGLRRAFLICAVVLAARHEIDCHSRRRIGENGEDVSGRVNNIHVSNLPRKLSTVHYRVVKSISKSEHRLLAKSVTNRVDVSREQLGPAGAPSAITVVAIMKNETRDEMMRLQDRSLRAFDVEVLLTKQLMPPETFNASFTKEDGAALIKLATKIKVDTADPDEG
jgi:hypothetical protein